MKSSSELFPVSLLRAETIGNLTDDVYEIKHGLDDDKTVKIALSRIGIVDQSAENKEPLVLVHGSFSNRGFWLSAKGVGLARYLVEQGFDVWLLEMRGHGLSPINTDYRNNCIDSYVRTDIPAVNQFVTEKTGKKPTWIGHSLGGVIISTAMASGHLAKEDINRVVLLGTQYVRRRWYMYLPFAASLGHLFFLRKEIMDGVKIGIGPENEPAGIAHEYLRRFGWFGGWRLRKDKTPLLKKWKEQHVPLLAMVGSADKSDPAKYCKRFFDIYGADTPFTPKDFILLCKKEGFQKNYGHVDAVVSKEAAEEVWPKISEWLKKDIQTDA